MDIDKIFGEEFDNVETDDKFDEFIGKLVVIITNTNKYIGILHSSTKNRITMNLDKRGCVSIPKLNIKSIKLLYDGYR